MSAARDEILSRVRAALADVAPDPATVKAPVMPALSTPAMLDLFVERVADYRAVIERCAPTEVADRVTAALAAHVPTGVGVVVPVHLDFPDLAVPGAVVDTGLSAHELDGVAAVVTRAAVAIAETGTIVLDHGPGQGRRALSLVPDVHVCIVVADQVVPDVPDAIAFLQPAVERGQPLTWISGPSATSDIELDRVEGVHGPRTLHVVLVEP